MSDVKVYGFIPSQPTRTVLAFLKLSNIEYTLVKVDSLAGENLTEEYSKINPFQSVPALVHGDYNLWESGAIIAYLAETFNLDNSWYPKDAKLRGRINAYIHWHHQGVREPCMNYLVSKITGPRFRGMPVLTEEQEVPIRDRFNQFLADLKWLLADTKFVARTEGPTIADIFAYNELTLVLGLFSFDQHPEVKAWFDQIGAVPQVKELTDECMQIVAPLLG